MINLTKLVTESRNSLTVNLDQMTTEEVLKAMNNEDKTVAEAVEKELSDIAKAVEHIIEAFNNDARLIYFGAGTSGRVGVVDAVECPPTFGTHPDKVVALIAGGDKAFVRAVEGAEDSLDLAKEELMNIKLTKNDVVVGIAASGRTPYVIGGLNYAKEVGCKTVSVSCNKNSEVGKIADVAIEVETGSEVLTGSTRLKAGTSQKMVANMLTTASMIGVGKVYKNLMVDVQQTNKKLITRAENIVIEATEVSREVAKETLQKSNGSVKLAITMLLLNTTADEAEAKLQSVNGHIRKAII